MCIKAFLTRKCDLYRERIQALELRHDQSFGRLMAIVLGAIALWAAWHGESWRTLTTGALSAAFFTTTLLRPAILRPLNAVWLLIGLVLETVINPLVMLLIFGLAFTPFALIFKLTGRDELHLKKDATKNSTWCKRDFSPRAEDFKNQF